MNYNQESKRFYIKIYTEYVAYELYLDQKYHQKQNNSVNKVLNTCLNSGWVLSEEEKEIMIKKAIEIAKNKYEITSVYRSDL